MVSFYLKIKKFFFNKEILSFAALRSKEIQLLEYIKDFQSDKLSYKHESYQKIKNIKNLQDFKEMKTNGIYDKYKNEVLELSNYVEVILIHFKFLNNLKGFNFKRQ